MAKIAILPRVIPLEGGMMLVESRTRWNSYHMTDAIEGTCSCEDTHFRGRECVHLRFARSLVAAAKDRLKINTEIN